MFGHARPKEPGWEYSPPPLPTQSSREVVYIVVRNASPEQGGQFDAAAYLPVIDVRRGDQGAKGAGPIAAQDVAPPRAQRLTWRLAGQVALFASAVTTIVAVLSALSLWDVAGAAALGLDPHGAYFLFAGAVYLIAALLCCAWYTHLLRDVRHISWDVKMMLGANLAVGGAVAAALAIVVLAAVAIIWLLGYVCAGLFSRSFS